MRGHTLEDLQKYKKIADSKPKNLAQRGFTLIEMMIVVAIIAIIAAIIALNYAHSKSNAQVSSTEANMKQIATALEVYYADNQTYPASSSVSSTTFGGAGNPYMNSTPNSPGSGGGAYVYTLSTNDYTIADPATYDTQSIKNLPKGGAPAGSAPSIAGSCVTACTHIAYSNEAGIFGYP